MAGVTWGTKDPTLEPDKESTKEAEFLWVEPLKPQWRTGILGDGVKDSDGVERVPFMRVGSYVWPKSEEMGRRVGYFDCGTGEGNEPGIQRIGVFLHGGGYCHMSAHESSRTSRIPRGLINVSFFFDYSSQPRLRTSF